MYARRMAGVTLVELIVAIVIVGVALAGLVVVYNRTNIASADPLATQQMLAIAEATMDDVLLKPFTDLQPQAESAIVDVNGDPVPGLERYKVQVQVDQPGTDGVPAITGVPTSEARRIRVTVSGAGDPILLTGWRTKP